MKNNERSTWKVSSCCREPHLPPSFSFKEEEGDLCISSALCIEGWEKGLCCAVFSSPMRMKLTLSFEFYYSLAKLSSVVLCTSRKSFLLPLKRQLRCPLFFFAVLLFVQNSANKNGSRIKGVSFLVKHKKILIFGPEAVDCHKQSAAKIINLCCLPNWY